MHASDTSDRLDDRQLIARIAQGDMAAMKLFYHRHSPTVQRFAQRYVNDPVEAADIVQITMMEVWRSAADYKGQSSPRTWVLSIAKFKSIDHVRRDARATPTDPQSEAFNAVDDATAETIVATAQDAARVRACVAALPQAQRSAIHLAFFADQTYAEVAAIEGVPEGTIKTRIYHAKQALMRCLGGLREND